ncbi:MAG TPA: flavoprotein [Verrucomicrobiae bacterium]|jgi:phosphopantothenoylcysteine decarboxylase/phosphopantothenate--cysteine ligase|nr:flavoprotein [Verrucomicrobiae bacterium]
MKNPRPAVKNPKKLKGKNLLLILSGSIAAYKSGDVIKELREAGAKVTCVLTKGAQEFVTPLTLRAVSGQPVYGEFFAADTPYDVIHTSLAEESDAVLIAPASANFIARLAAGMADDLASCIVLATRKPVIVVPAMNDQMYYHTLTQKNLATLREVGYEIVDPIQGDLVCGRTAMGHISDTKAILEVVARCAGKK